MDAIFLQVLNGLDKGGAYALIALGLTLVFGTLGVVNFAHGALFMFGAFCAVSLEKVLTISTKVKDESITFFDAYKEVPILEAKFPVVGAFIVDYSVPFAVLLSIPIMLLIGLAMERGLIRHFYKRPHADQILVTFGLAIICAEIIRHYFGANPIPQSAPSAVSGSANIGSWFGLGDNVVYPWWRIIYLGFSLSIIAAVFGFLQFTTFGMVVRAGMQDREQVGLLGINIQRRFTIVFGLAAVVAGVAGVMYTPILPPDYNMGMDFLVLSFVVVVVGGMGSLGGAVLAGFLLGILQSFASMNEVKSILPGIDQIIIYLVAVIVLLVRPRGHLVALDDFGVDDRRGIVAGIFALAGRVREQGCTECVVRVCIGASHAFIDHVGEAQICVPLNVHTHLDEHGDNAGVLTDRAFAHRTHARIHQNLCHRVSGSCRLLAFPGCIDRVNVVFGVVTGHELQGVRDTVDQIVLFDDAHKTINSKVVFSWLAHSL